MLLRHARVLRRLLVLDRRVTTLLRNMNKYGWEVIGFLGGVHDGQARR